MRSGTGKRAAPSSCLGPAWPLRGTREPSPAAAPPTPAAAGAISPEPGGAGAGFPRCAWEAGGLRMRLRGRDPEELLPPNTHTRGPPLRLHPPEATAGDRRFASDTPTSEAAPKPRRPLPPVRTRGPNSIAPGLMNSRALIGSPGALWIYACRLSSRGRRARPGSLPMAPASRLAGGSGRRRGPRRRGGASPESGLGFTRRGLHPRPGPTEPRRLPASPGLSGAAPPAAPPKREPNPGDPPAARAPTPGQRRPRGKASRGRAPASPFSPHSLIRGLSAAPRLPGCPGRPAGILETVPSLSPFIKRPWAALKPRSQ